MKGHIPRAGVLATWACVAFLLAACGGGGGGSNSPMPAPPDSAAPDTMLAGAPPALTNANSATFTFTATESATFEVRLDGAAFVAAASPHALSNLADGSHTLEVRARDAAGNLDATPASATWVVDTAPPDTQVTAGPAPIVGLNTASFTAVSPDPGATFEVSLDGATYVATTMPYLVNGVAGGAHNIAFRARDAAGNLDTTPATHQWVYDNQPPDVLISAPPASITNATTASIAFFTVESMTSFEASIDGASFAAATSPLQLVNLSEGVHEVLIRARDAVGNVDATPAVASWRVDVTPPSVNVLFPTAVSYTDASTLTFRGTAQDTGGIRAISVGLVEATSSDGFAHWSAVVPIAAGAIHNLYVNAQDRAGNSAANVPIISVSNNGPVLTRPGDIDYDPTGNRLVVTDEETRSVLAYRASDGLGRLVSAADRSNTPGTSALTGLAVDSANNRALVIDSGADALVAVDLTTGTRTTLSSGSGPGPTQLSSGYAIALDAANNRVFITVPGMFSVVAVDLASGVRSVVTGPGVGSGISLFSPMGIELDRTTGTHLYVGDAGATGFSAPAIYEINIATGSRVQFSRPFSPMQQGPTFSQPAALRMDSQRVWLYVLETTGTGGVFRVLMNGFNRGDRESVAFNGPGGGTGEDLAAARGLARKDATGDLYIAQRNGEVLVHSASNRVRTALVHSRVGAGVRLENPLAVIIEQLTGAPTSLLTTDPTTGLVVRMSLATGNRSVVSGGGVGQGAAFGIPRDIVLDTRPAAGPAALVLDVKPGAESIVSINLSNGTRTQLADITPVHGPRALRLDAGANRALFSDDDFNVANDDALYAVNLATQLRTTLSGPARGGGAGFSVPTHFVLEPAQNPVRAILVDTLPWQILSVDLATGNRGPFISNDGSPALPLTGPLYLDSGGSRLLGINLFPQHLFEIPLPVNGAQTRSLISGLLPDSGTIRGTGPLPYVTSGLDVHAATGVAFVSAANSHAIFAIDLVSGDRVIVSH